MISDDEWRNCLDLLRRVARNTDLAADQTEFKTLVAKINRGARRKLKASAAFSRRQNDADEIASVLASRRDQLNRLEIEESGPERLTQGALRCYACASKYQRLHHFYHRLCPDCAELNYRKRLEIIDLSGRIAVVTGGRVKIGFEVALRLLRQKARVIVTTRFPVNALRRYQAEADYADWGDRLDLYGLDLRYLSDVHAFAEWLDTRFGHIDILINNAAQTIRRTADFYAPLLADEREEIASPCIAHRTANRFRAVDLLLTTQAKASPLPVDRYGEVVETPYKNSWYLRLDEVDTREMVETQVINAMAPFILCAQARGLMRKSPRDKRFIVNVGAMEGQFSHTGKGALHPHNNMSKAALSMLTRTAAVDYATDGIFMNSVDPGWISSETPRAVERRVQGLDYDLPLDCIDAAARILDPIVQSLDPLCQAPPCGLYWKDYRPSEW
ncbi:SDR family NAD(P)-dependent oxidoreductase [Labrys neptuniae]|uniref:SDR family oxidoreductase n=1 Tax=Labrys neptuniae TaxID=376174 RepID=A0ABV3PHC9_9HYPH